MLMKVKIGNNIFNVKVAATTKEVQEGMMNKNFDKTFNGMLFVMKKYDFHCFWMKNCITNLDIVFIGNNRITEIHSDCPKCVTKDCKNYCGFGELVLELPSKTCESLNIKKGDKVEII
jgi:uncharacterized membrane protein (UPF0127 family)